MSDPDDKNPSWQLVAAKAIDAFTKRPTTPLTHVYWIVIAVIGAAFALSVLLAFSPLAHIVPWILCFAGFLALVGLLLVPLALKWGKTHHVQLGQVGPKQFMEIQAQERVRLGDDQGAEYERTRGIILHVTLTPEEKETILAKVLNAPSGTVPMLSAPDEPRFMTLAGPDESEEGVGNADDEEAS